jgi:hypothetical protein
MPSRLHGRDIIPQKFRVVHVMIKVKSLLGLFYEIIQILMNSLKSSPPSIRPNPKPALRTSGAIRLLGERLAR